MAQRAGLRRGGVAVCEIVYLTFRLYSMERFHCISTLKLDVRALTLHYEG